MRRILSCIVLLCLACGDKSEATSVPPAPSAETKASAAAAPTPKPAPAPAAAPAPAPAAAAAAGVDETSARALVESWLKAQNTGDFASYESLYAQRFDGEKRAGERLYKF